MYIMKQGSITRKLALRTSAFTVLGTACLLSVYPAAVAQTSGEDSFVKDEIIVTARKTEESLQDVSLAISAFTADDIKKRSLTELENVALQTPGFTFEDFSNGGFGAPVIRGTSQIRVNLLEQNVSVFYDGIYIPRQYAFDSGTANIERIEVVKGPQSALYGANSFSGAINYVSPERDLTTLGGSVTGGLGLDGLLEARGDISIPIVKDVLAVSLAASHSEFDGDFDNNFPGAENANRRGTDEDIGGWDRDSLSAGLTFSQGGLTAKGDYTRFENLSEVGAGYTITNIPEGGETGFFFGPPGGTTNCGLSNGFASANSFTAFCGRLPSTPPVGLSGVEGNVIFPGSFIESQTEIFRGELSYELSDEIDATYLYGNVDSEVFGVGSADSDPIVGSSIFAAPGSNSLVFSPVGGADYETHELRVNYENDAGWSFLAGVYLLNGEDDDIFGANFFPLDDTTQFTTADVTADSVAIFTNQTIETDTTAIFGRFSAPITDTVTLSAEARYSDTDIDSINFDPFGGGDPVLLTNSFSSFTPRVNLDWKVTDDNLLYASFARGVKNGGINVSNVELSEEETFFDEDQNDSYEIGTKNTFLDGRATLNIAAYLIDWSDLQIGVLPSSSTGQAAGIVQNLGSATSKGIEADGTFYLTENISVNAGASFIDATYDDGTISSRGGFFCDDVICNADGDVSGNDLARVPDFQWNVGAQYDGELPGDYEYFLRGDVAGQSSQQVSEFNITSIEGRTLVNGRAGISKGPISLDIWVTNLLDEEYVSNSFFIANGFQQQYTATLGAARRAGVELSYDF